MSNKRFLTGIGMIGLEIVAIIVLALSTLSTIRLVRLGFWTAIILYNIFAFILIWKGSATEPAGKGRSKSRSYIWRYRI